MGLILDLAVVAIAAVVVASLALLAWTLAVTAVGSVQGSRRTIAELRQSVAEAEGRLVASSARLLTAIQDLERRTRRSTGPRSDEQTDTRARRAQPSTGEQADA